MFDGVASDLTVYTQLIENNEGIKFGKQSLPLSEMESSIIPLGVKALANKEITFSVTIENLSKNVILYLEDKEANTFTSFNSGDIKIILTENLNGVGRFYLHVSGKSLSTVNDSLDKVVIHQSNPSNLNIVGLSNIKTSLKLYSILGNQVVNTSFIAKGNDDIALPKLAKGIYLIQLENKDGKLNKKIILK